MRFFSYAIFLAFLLPFTYPLNAQIKTVTCHPAGNPFAEPVIGLGQGQQLVFSFDDLNGQTNSYTYKIQHCDPEWNSSNLSPFQYLTGFFSNPFQDYQYSSNKGIPYTRFTLLLPNDDIGIKLAGNYLLQIYNDENPDTPVMSQRFAVLDNNVAITAAVVNTTIPKYLYSSQQIDFTVDYNNLSIRNPVSDVRAYIVQNQDPNTRREFKPVFIRRNQLVYGDGINNVFNGLSPFRNFDCSSLVYYSQYVKDVIEDADGINNFILVPEAVPSRYVPLANRKGNFYIQAENTTDPDVNAEYVKTHFAIRYPEPIPDADVYIYGKFSGWQLLPALKMNYDPVNKAYVGQGMFKQGYYEYMYAVAGKKEKTIDLVKMQNNFYQTINDYSIYFYVFDYDLKYFKLVGYKEVTARF